MLKLSDYALKTAMINMLRALMEKGDTMQEQMGNVSREMEILRRDATDQKQCTEMKNAFDGLIRRRDTAEERTLSLRI